MNVVSYITVLIMLLHGLALINGKRVVKMSYGGVKATPEATDMGPLYGHEYDEQSLRIERGLPPSPKPNHLHHQFVPAPPPLLSRVMGSKLFPRPPPRRLLL
nr:hypothetical protein DM860_010712 [Ipomoea trifida]